MENQMETQMEKKSRLWLLVIVIGLILVGILAAVWASLTFDIITSSRFPFRPLPAPEFNPADLEFYYIAKTVVSTINIALLVFLIATYVTIYSKTKSEFTIGLLIFAVIFLIKDLTASPFITGAFGFRLYGLGPFALLPDVFELAALSVLLYLSVKY
jgi:hypothetical protein